VQVAPSPPGSGAPGVLNLFSQVEPGPPGAPGDSAGDREGYAASTTGSPFTTRLSINLITRGQRLRCRLIQGCAHGIAQATNVFAPRFKLG
jgi:hypothetical protein